MCSLGQFRVFKSNIVKERGHFAYTFKDFKDILPIHLRTYYSF